MNYPFEKIKKELNEYVHQMFIDNDHLYVVEIDKDAIWNVYLDSFPPGTNELFRERREYDCTHCKQFIRAIGGVVAVTDEYKLKSIWDMIPCDDTFKPVFAALSKYVKSHDIFKKFLTCDHVAGVDFNMSQEEIDGEMVAVKYNHFYTEIDKKFIFDSSNSAGRKLLINSELAEYTSNMETFERSLNMISKDSVDTVLELIADNSIYKGAEWKEVLTLFRSLMIEYIRLDCITRKNFCWVKSVQHGPVVSKIKNHSIGTLLTDISDGVPLDEAVRKYEAIVAPSNYKRPKEIFTKRMLQDAKDLVEELGLTNSLRRRFANIDDISINNLLYADRTTKNRINNEDIFDELSNDVASKPKTFDRATEVHIDKFISDILPTCNKVELFLEADQAANVVSLIAPVDKDSKPLFKWGNNFSWSYKGNVTDAIKENVAKAGGKVDGVLRFSIQWNENGNNQDDLDAHAIEPTNNVIYFKNKGCRHPSSGMLDVDIISPDRNVAVENIVYTDINKMPIGKYVFKTHMFTKRCGDGGFRAQIEFNGTIYNYEYLANLPQNAAIVIATVELKADRTFSITHNLPTTASTKDISGCKVNQFHGVSACMLSPNYWDGKAVGNKHYMFILNDMVNDESPNGFYNEYLDNSLLKHKRVFSALGSKLKLELSDNQFTGLGFSSTINTSFIVKVQGQSERVLRVIID